MNRLLFSSAASGTRCAPSLSQGFSGARRYASGPIPSAEKQNKSANIASIFLGVGVIAAGGAYYLQRTGATVPGSDGKAGNPLAALTATTASTASKTAGALDPSKFVNFKLKEIQPYNHNTSRFIFEIPAELDSGLTVASAVLLKPVKEGLGLDAKGKPAIRPYTPVSTPDTKGRIEFLIKKYDNGAMSSHLHKDLQPGDEIAIKGPLPKHPWKANEFEQVAMIAGGTGIAPMYQLLQAIDRDPNDKTKVNLLFANVTEDDILLKEALTDLSKRKPEQFNIQHVIERPGKSWKGYKGFIGRDALNQNLPLPGHGDKIKIFVCGPPPMVEVVCGEKASPKDQGPLKGYLADAGYQPSQIYKF